MKKAQRMERKAAHAAAYREGWNDCEAFYAKVLARMEADAEIECTPQVMDKLAEYVHGELVKEGFAPLSAEVQLVVNLVVEAMCREGVLE